MRNLSNLYVSACRFLVGPPEDRNTPESISYERRRAHFVVLMGSGTLLLANVAHVMSEAHGHPDILGGVGAVAVIMGAMQADGLNMLSE